MQPLLKVVSGLILALVFNSSAAAADIAEYQSGDIRLLRLTDKPGGVAQKVMIGNPQTIASILGERMCPGEFVSFLALAGPEAVLVDSGYGQAAGGKTLQLLREAGYPPEKIDRIALTHLHPDHVGGLINNGKKAFPAAKVHVDAREYNYWKEKVAKENSDFILPAKDFLRLYKDDIVLFNAGENVLPWLKSTPVPGHTPGHTVFSAGNGKDKYFIGGDAIHCLEVQARNPEITVIWDTDQDMARQNRIKFLQNAADEGSIVLGGHFPSPGAVRFTRNSGSGFEYESIPPVK